jgi:hypothetical protein
MHMGPRFRCKRNKGPAPCLLRTDAHCFNPAPPGVSRLDECPRIKGIGRRHCHCGLGGLGLLVAPRRDMEPCYNCLRLSMLVLSFVHDVCLGDAWTQLNHIGMRSRRRPTQTDDTTAPLMHRWRLALLGWAVAWGIAWGIAALPQLPNPEALILAIVLVVLIAWLIGRLRTSR